MTRLALARLVPACAAGALAAAAGGLTASTAAATTMGAAARSAAATVREPSASDFYVRGGGFGHGIGMSQYGALGYAQHGWSYQRILAHYYRGTGLGSVPSTHLVKVLLGDGGAAFSGADKVNARLLSHPKTAKARAAAMSLNPSATYTVRATSGGNLELRSGSKEVGVYASPLKVSGHGPLTLAGVGSYRGSFVFRPDGSGGVQTVNAVGIEDYVRGVISGEMPSSWARAALEAQAVAARTYAITVAPVSSSFDVYSDTRSQMYVGVGAETPSTNAATRATSGRVVTYRGTPAVTYFFSSSGGYTESIQNVWLGATPEPWLRGVPDPYDGAGGNPYHRWTLVMSIGHAAVHLGSAVRGSLVGIQVLHHGVSPRVISAAVLGTRGRTTATGPELQADFGLRSTYVDFTSIWVRGLDRPPHSSGTGTGTGSGSGGTGLGSGKSAAGRRGLSGRVFPVRGGALVAVQEQERHGGWRTIERVRPERSGDFDVAIPGPGRYRIAYYGADGPAISVR